MTESRAVELLKNNEERRTAGTYIVVKHLSIIALEKQIPKKPYIQQDDRNNDCLECPSCDSFIGYEYDCRDEHYQINYCPCCGQAIDWSDKE